MCIGLNFQFLIIPYILSGRNIFVTKQKQSKSLENQTILLTFITIYLLATIGIGYYASRFVKNTNDFVIAGRRMPTSIVAAGLFATWFGSETVMGATTEFVDKGILGIIEEPLGASLCLFLIGFFIAKPLYKLNLMTFSDYFSQRYGRITETISAVMMIPSYFGWIAAQLIALATVLHTIVPSISIFWGVVICAFVVMLYTFVGGMWAVSLTDFVQTIMIILGIGLMLYDSLDKAGGLGRVVAAQPEGFFNLTPEWTFKNTLQYFAAWITVGLGSIPQQDVFQRVMSAKSEKVAVRGAFVSSFMYLTVASMPLIIALCGKLLYPELLEGATDEKKQMLLPFMVLNHGSLLLKILFFGSLLSAIMSTASGAILAPSTVIGENIIKPYFSKITDKQLLAIMRGSVVVVTLISVIFASMNSNIFELVSQSSAISLVSLFVPLVFGLYWRRTTGLAALLSMVLGFITWLLTEVYIHLYLNPDDAIPSILVGLGVSVFTIVGTSYLDKNDIITSIQHDVE